MCFSLFMSFCWGRSVKAVEKMLDLTANNCIGKDSFCRHAAVLVSSIKVIPSSS